jgi:hypothetical protein
LLSLLYSVQKHVCVAITALTDLLYEKTVKPMLTKWQF